MSKNKTLEEWIKFYEKKTGVPYEEPDSRTIRIFFPDRGFAEIGVSKNMVIVHQMAGDGRFWKQVAEVMAKERNINHLGSWVIREVKAYIRFFGVDVERVEEIGEGLKRYHGKFKDNGKKVLFTPHFKSTNGNVGYIVTWEI